MQEHGARARVATGIALSGEFDKGDDREAATGVYVFADDATAAREFTAVSADTPRCYAKALRKAIDQAAGFAVRSIRTTKLRVKPAGDQQAAGHVRLAVTARGQRVVVHVDRGAGRPVGGLPRAQRSRRRFCARGNRPSDRLRPAHQDLIDVHDDALAPGRDREPDVPGRLLITGRLHPRLGRPDRAHREPAAWLIAFLRALA